MLVFFCIRPSLECFRVCQKEVLEVVEVAAGLVRNTLLVILWVEDNRWELVDRDSLDFVLCAVHLGDDDVVETFNVLAELSPDGSKGLAVATPRCVILDEDVSGRVSDNVLPVVANNNFDWSVVRGRDVLRLQEFG